MVLTWFLLMTLWLPAANFRKSYREIVGPVREILSAEGSCVTGFGLDVAQRALLAYYGNARFVRLPRMDGSEPMAKQDTCHWMLVSDRESAPHEIAAISPSEPEFTSAGGSNAQAGAGWALVWHGQRRVNRGERLFLYARDGLAMK
jgi:hypothetical protein